MYDYLIVGAGRAGASAVEGIRSKDEEGAILLIGREDYIPYDRPDLSKKLWSGKKTVDDLFPLDRDFYMDNSIDLLLDTTVKELNPRNKTLKDSRRNVWGYNKLLLATGGSPRKLDIPGGDLEEIFYYRNLNDYKALREQVGENKTAVIIGGGFIGSELAAALSANGVRVQMIFPDPWLVNRVFPENLAVSIEGQFKKNGISICTGDTPVSIDKNGKRFVTTTREGKKFESDIVIVGAGIKPSTELAEMAKLQVGNGIVVNENLQTSDQNIYAAGDNAFFPYSALGVGKRVEHWDNAREQGKRAGMNMAGVRTAYDYMPYFWSDLFEFGYEAVGEVDSSLDIITDWQTENEKGVIYYLKDRKVRGIMTCNIYGQVDEARKIIRQGKELLPDDLKGAIK